MTPTQIFDRTEIVQMLNTACLGEAGTSAAVVSSHKLGKTSLLQYLLESSNADSYRPGQKLIFCNINVDMFRAIAGSGNTELDQAFLHFLLDRLGEQLEYSLDELSRTEQCRTQEIADKRAKVTATPPPPQELADVLRNRVNALEQEQRELEYLRRAMDMLSPLRDAQKIDITAVARVLDKVKRAQKRVLMVIDDFDEILTQRGFTNALFSFLRGAAMDRRLISIVSTKEHPMSENLHPNLERRSLLNHLRVEWLSPFDEQQANTFLDEYLGGEGKLTPEERDYLRELGGGSPHFLKIVYEEFMRAGKPGPKQRRQFEAGDLTPCVFPHFQQIWARCSPEQRSLLRTVADGTAVAAADPVAQFLRKEGYLNIGGGGVSLFSSLFGDFVKGQPADPAPIVQASAVVQYKVFPTALCIAMPGKMEPLVTFAFSNPGKAPVRIRFGCELKDFSEKAHQELDLPPSSNPSVSLKVLRKLQPVQINNPTWALVSVWAEKVVIGQAASILSSNSDDIQVRMLPPDTFVFARRDVVVGRLVEYSWLIAAWVNDRDPAIRKLVIDARAALGRDLTGYQAIGQSDVPTEARAQAGALYEALQQVGIGYDDTATIYHQNSRDYSQQVRLPRESIDQKTANCLDGSVLFASLLSAVGLHPIILLLPGHAIAGWRDTDRGPANFEFVETTFIGARRFDEALAEGRRLYLLNQSLIDEWETEPTLKDPKRFAIPVDIHEQWRNGVVSIA